MMKDTIYGLDNEAYHNEPPFSGYLSSTDLKLYLQSPKHYKYVQEHPQPQTDAMRFGSLFHDCMGALAEGGQPESILDAIAVFTPPTNPKTGQPYGVGTKAYQKEYDAFVEGLNGTLVSSASEKETVGLMMDSLLYGCGSTSEQVRKLLKWTKATEVSYFYETEDGIKLKVRPDALTSNKVLDWKTCALDTLDEESIARQIVKYRYDISLSMYQWVLQKITGKWYEPYLIFICKNPPYECVIADISEWCYTYNKQFDILATGVGAQEFQRLLELHTKCVKSNEWPGVEFLLPSGSNSIMKPAIPAYFNKRYEE